MSLMKVLTLGCLQTSLCSSRVTRTERPSCATSASNSRSGWRLARRGRNPGEEAVPPQLMFDLDRLRLLAIAGFGPPSVPV
jgi:hypothetical protein